MRWLCFMSHLNVMSAAPGRQLPQGGLIEVLGGPSYAQLIAAQNALNFTMRDLAMDVMFSGRPVPPAAQKSFTDHDLVTFEDQGAGRWILKLNAENQATAMTQWGDAARAHGATTQGLNQFFESSIRSSVFSAQLRDRAAAKLNANVSVATPPPTLGQRLGGLVGAVAPSLAAAHQTPQGPRPGR